jgi:flagellar hook protein FlgE
MAMDALYAGVTGLQVNQQMLDVVGNNLANSNTTGFKSQSVNFSDLVYQNLTQATAASGNTVGGTNPIQIGSGAQVASVSPNFQQGTLQSTGNDLDVALQGNGFFVVRDGSQDLYTRAGSFGVDSDNYLVDPATGNRVQRFDTVGEASTSGPAFQTPGNDDIRIPIGTGVPGALTSNVVLQGNLSTSALGPLAQVLTSTQAFTTGSPPQPATALTTLNSLADNMTPYVAGDTLNLQGSDATGAAVNVSVPVGPASTLGDVLNAINTNFQGVTASLDSSGNLIVAANNTGPSKLNLTIADTAGDKGSTNWGNHLMAVTTMGKDGDVVNTSIQVYDAQGTAHTLNLTFQKKASNSWDLTGQISAADGVMTDNLASNITFNQDGSFSQVSGTGVGNPTMAVQFTGFGAPQTISFNFGSPGGFNGLTQTGGSSSAVATGQNGYAAGSLSSLSIGQDGVINGVFTNGKTLALAQLAVANFANPAALNRVGNNNYALSSESGPPLVGAGLSAGNGAVEQKQLESSNVDVSLEFTRLIIAQQGYEVNAHVITEANQILQDLANIIR